MGFFDLFTVGASGSGGSKDRYRQESGRYGKKGAFRKERNGDRVERGKNGRYTK